ncbi:hypothetical protein HI914_06855 [Erysiphe necator]|nr:hypothetical protein HI914_06855 [Erysiphe necator]
MSIPIRSRRRFLINNLDPKRCTQTIQKNYADYKLDQVSGQVYTETIIRGSNRDDSYWEYKSNLAPIFDPSLSTPRASDYNKSKSGNDHFKGTRSLLLLSLEVIVSNAMNLTADMLIDLPINLVEMLWKEISERSLISFYLWSIFSVKLFKQGSYMNGKLTYYQTILSPKSPIAIYIQPLKSISYEFITALVITTTFLVPDLIEISTLFNLVTLEIINYSDPRQSVVSDFLIKAWSLCIDEKKSFQVLRMLRFWNHWEVTPKSLEYLLHFPVLTLCDVRGCNFESFKSQKYPGWEYRGNDDSLLSLKPKCFKTQNCIYYNATASTKKPTQGKSKYEGRYIKTRMLIDMICQDCAPLACLFLGPAGAFHHKPSWFLRVECSEQDNIKKSLISQLKVGKPQRATGPRGPSSPSPRRILRQNNKRKLDDFLLEFS